MSKSSDDKKVLAQFLANKCVLIDPVRSDEDNDVWTSLLTLLRQLWGSYENYLHEDYLRGLKSLDISTSKIPSLSDINTMLSSIGWSAVYVDGMVDDRLYQEMQAAQIFPIARHIRRKRDIFHSAAPDFMHDVIGHLPMLFSPQYRSLLNEWARSALTAAPDSKDIEARMTLLELIEEREKERPNVDAIAKKTTDLEELYRGIDLSPSRAARFARFYAWAVEFGVMRANDDDDVKISGSAALSSPGEFNRIVSGETQMRSFSAYAITSPVNYSVVQDTMFVARDFSEYSQVLAGI